MVQLTLLETDDAQTLAWQVGSLKAGWSARLGDDRYPAEAGRVTMARFASWGNRILGARERSRVSAYFGAVLRRRLLRTPDPASALARKRLVAASIEADLMEAGWDVQRAAEEARRVTGEVARYGGAA